MVDADRRPSPIALQLAISRNSAGHRGERDRPALWRRRQSPAPELGLSRLLRPVLPGASALDGHRSAARFSQQPEFHFRSPARRARSKNTSSASRFPFAAGRSTPILFKTRATNWLDHNNIGESNLFWPITWDAALIQGWELTLRSPRLWHRGQFHLAYSNQIAQATSPITGGLICPPVDANMPILSAAWICTGRPRSEKHVELGFQCKSSLADVRFDECVLRLGIPQRDSGRAISRELSAAAHHV